MFNFMRFNQLLFSLYTFLCIFKIIQISLHKFPICVVKFLISDNYTIPIKFVQYNFQLSNTNSYTILIKMVICKLRFVQCKCKWGIITDEIQIQVRNCTLNTTNFEFKKK